MLVVGMLAMQQCGNDAKQTDNKMDNDSLVGKQVPEWTKNSVIYEVNVRQFSEAGTFKAFSDHLQRIRDLGVDILWFMPIQPIGLKNRKGSLGSYYSISDYTAVNPEFGTLEDFKELVGTCHAMGFKVILDWVANHTAWDNLWVEQHPDWYKQDSAGNVVSPVADWADVAGLNYENREMRKAMIDAMKFWITESDIDGFRCDVAGMVPTDFWNEVRPELDKVKPVFMLAEWEETPELHEKAFDMTYTWKFHHLICDIAKGNKKATEIDEYLHWNDSLFPKSAYRMYFTSNHDENSWNGTVFERLGEGYKAFAVLTFAIPGMPLIYGGQEAGLDKRLPFFDKGEILWKEHEMAELYEKLIAVKHENSALWNGKFGGSFTRVGQEADSNVYVFMREQIDNKILAIFNLSDEEKGFTFPGILKGDYTELLRNEPFVISGNTIRLQPWEYYLMKKKG